MIKQPDIRLEKDDGLAIIFAVTIFTSLMVLVTISVLKVTL